MADPALVEPAEVLLRARCVDGQLTPRRPSRVGVPWAYTWRKCYRTRLYPPNRASSGEVAVETGNVGRVLLLLLQAHLEMSRVCAVFAAGLPQGIPPEPDDVPYFKRAEAPVVLDS